MIIELLLTGIFNILENLFVFQLPQLPDGVMDVLTEMFDYIASACGIVANYTDLGYLLVLFGVILAIDMGIGVYHFVMWVIRKIPVLGIE